jgi:cysteinyl-tRNA synthetase
MNVLRLYNSQSKAKEEFRPLNGNNVRMYACGLTVYNSPHLGNARAFVVPDILRRWLEFRGYNVRFVTNFTDIDDKIIRRAAEEKTDWRDITTQYIAEYHRMALALNVKPADAYPRATDNIEEMIELIERLFARGHAYVSSDGDVYFHSPSFSGYGALSGRKAEEEEEGAGLSGRLTEKRQAAKKHSCDFVLWKSAKPGEPSWPAPWGAGRPGWHIECSAMARRWLGLPFDIHCGGADLLFPHHEDEKAQSECAYADELQGRESVRFWVHNGFLTIGQEDDKMSKSQGNMKYVRELIHPDGPFEPAVLRMFLLSAHYRSPLRFEMRLLEEAKARLERIRDFVTGLESRKVPSTTPPPTVVQEAEKEFDEAMDDDLNTAMALAALFKLGNTLVAPGTLSCSPEDAGHAYNFVEKRLRALGLDIRRTETAANQAAKIPQELLDLLGESRQKLRSHKDFQFADHIRNELVKLNCEVKDLGGGKCEVKQKS